MPKFGKRVVQFQKKRATEAFKEARTLYDRKWLKQVKKVRLRGEKAFMDPANPDLPPIFPTKEVGPQDVLDRMTVLLMEGFEALRILRGHEHDAIKFKLIRKHLNMGIVHATCLIRFETVMKVYRGLKDYAKVHTKKTKRRKAKAKRKK